MKYTVKRIDEILYSPLSRTADTAKLISEMTDIARVVQSYFTDMTNEEYAAWGVKNCAVVRYDF